MKYKIKYILLVIGIVLVFLSFLFFGRQQNTYIIILLSGCFVSVTSFLTILFGKHKLKEKITWTIIVSLSVLALSFSESRLIRTSFIIYINSNQTELYKINNLLSNHTDEISFHGKNVFPIENSYSDVEIDLIKNLKEELDVYMITKSQNGIYYGLFGFLDVRIGIWYSNDEEVLESGQQKQKLTGNWYY